MSVRKRKWITTDGAQREAWVANYTDQEGKRHLKTFRRKKDADAFTATANLEVRQGTHVPDNATVTVREAADAWIDSCQAAGLERSTVRQHRQHVDHHIRPIIGRTKLSQLSVPAIRAFQDRLREEGRSAAMIRKVTVSLGSLLADAQERGLVSRNAIREMSRQRRGRGTDKRRRLEVGRDIPSRDEIKDIINAAEGRWRPLIVTAVFTALRASELRALRWADVDLERKQLHVRRRADAWGQVGPPKSRAGNRTVPLPAQVVNTLKEWSLRCPRRPANDGEGSGELHYVFPNGAGNVESNGNILNRGWYPVQISAGVVVDTAGKDHEGNPVPAPKYKLHALRHFAASWFINAPAAGGIGLSLKEAQTRLGHATIAMTADVYGHLFPAHDDGGALSDAADALLS